MEHYRRAVQQNPNRTDYKIALERAMINASHVHLDNARVLEARGTSTTRCASTGGRASTIPRTGRSPSRFRSSRRRRARRWRRRGRSRPSQQMREQARRASPEPLLNPGSRDPLVVEFRNATLRDIFNSIGTLSGINVTYDRDFQDRTYSVQARRGDARAGAEPDSVGQPAVLQGAQRSHHHGDPRHAAEARAVRRAGHPHVLRLARRRHRAGAADQHDHPACRRWRCSR